ncbi:hypothetical protein AN1V17_07550 [Vallitalea sediminicola]
MNKRIFVVSLIIFIVGISVSCKNNKEEVKNYDDEYKFLVEEFSKGELSYKECNEFYQDIGDNKLTASITQLSSKMESINDSKNNYALGEEKFQLKQWLDSYKFLSSVINEDEENYNKAVEKKKEILSAYMDEAEKLALGYFYDEAIAKLEEINSYTNDSTIVKEKLAEYNTKKAELVLYEGEIRNIFFHSLIVYTELAFDGDFMQKGYNYWMTTVSEYKKMLEQMYERDYILIDINMLYETEYVNDKPVMKKKDLYLPKGKKPIILSLDDLNYYKYMEKDGFADRLVLDKNGNVATLTKRPDGGELIARDNDCVPITDVFVEEHPDFSYRGAKGVIAFTGYEGIMGYRIDLFDSPTFEKDFKTTKAIADKLKETGWRLGSHSYGHINFQDKGITRVKKDTKQWNDEVIPIIGKTNLFIYPYGASVKKDDERFKELQKYGFEVFWCVGGRGATLRYNDDYIFMDRCNLDGYKMHYGPKQLEDLFDIDYVYDKNRPKFE